MSSFDEATFISHLATLTLAQESITGLSKWILKHQGKYYDRIVKTWIKTVVGENDPIRMTMYLYVANDAIQVSRKKGPQFQDAFFPVLEKAFKHVGRANTKETEKCLNRLVSIWKDRGIYDAEKIERLEVAMKARKRSKVEESSNVNAPRSPKEHHHRHGVIGHVHHKKTRETAVYDADQFHRTIGDLKEVLLRLADPPSTNEKVRQNISDFPEYVGNVEKLNNLRNGEEAAVVKSDIDKAEPVVKDYCKVLSQEVMDRRNLQDLLQEFLGQSRLFSDRCGEQVNWLKKIKEKMVKDRQEMQTAYDSLPDFNDVPMETDESLPTFENLFMKR